jgi:catenin alpha
LEFFWYSSGRGPLRTTMDVINAAKMISECGSKLNKLAKEIAAQVSYANFIRNILILFI